MFICTNKLLLLVILLVRCPVEAHTFIYSHPYISPTSFLLLTGCIYEDRERTNRRKDWNDTNMVAAWLSKSTRLTNGDYLNVCILVWSFSLSNCNKNDFLEGRLLRVTKEGWIILFYSSTLTWLFSYSNSSMKVFFFYSFSAYLMEPFLRPWMSAACSTICSRS